MREDGRKADELRRVEIVPGYIEYPEGSCLIEFGKTRVLCTATIEDGIPRWMQVQGVPGGWVTGEYGMLPRATHQRSSRENNQGGRSQEIRRLIGRSLRAAVDLSRLGQRTCILDCDVLQADGGTRTAAISGAYVALAIALHRLVNEGQLDETVFKSPVAAVSAGVVNGTPLLDLNYAEDSGAEVDLNVVMNGRGEFIEVQATGEASTFPRASLDALLDLAYKGIGELLLLQNEVLQLYAKR